MRQFWGRASHPLVVLAGVFVVVAALASRRELEGRPRGGAKVNLTVGEGRRR